MTNKPLILRQLIKKRHLWTRPTHCAPGHFRHGDFLNSGRRSMTRVVSRWRQRRPQRASKCWLGSYETKLGIYRSLVFNSTFGWSCSIQCMKPPKGDTAGLRRGYNDMLWGVWEYMIIWSIFQDMSVYIYICILDTIWANSKSLGRSTRGPWLCRCRTWFLLIGTSNSETFFSCRNLQANHIDVQAV